MIRKPVLIVCIPCFCIFTFVHSETITPADSFPVGKLEPVPAIRQRKEWKSHTILVWQFQTDVRKDAPLYEQVGLHGFHIDRGAGRDDLVKLSLEKKYPYYVDHAAGKGILYIYKKEQSKVKKKRQVFARPYSLALPETIRELKSRLKRNVGTTKRGLVFAYAFDDEISLGSFNTPAEVDGHPRSVAWYRAWLKDRYGTITKLNGAWDAQYESFEDVQPVSYEDVRRSHTEAPLTEWNLARWCEWRSFMNFHFASVLADLTRYTNSLDPNIPAGFVGGQGPSAYGGYDYSLMSRAVQWMEAYDYNGTAELLRSFWDNPRRPCMQTYFTGSNYYRNSWVLWYRIANGCQANIAWPSGWFKKNPESGQREPSKLLKEIADTLRETQGKATEFITHPDTILDIDPIGIYYSQPSVHVGWAMDSVVHGSTWPNRSSSLDADNLTSGKLRVSWCKLLEDLGYQYKFISYLDVHEGSAKLGQFKVIIMPQTICLSDAEARALREFVTNGGFLIADTLCGVMTETGRGRAKGVLDDLFAISRNDSLGYMNGKSVTEINGEFYNKPLERRLDAFNGAFRFGDLVVYERGTKGKAKGAKSIGSAEIIIRNRHEKGQTCYLNLTPATYQHFPFRTGRMGDQWRGIVGDLLKDAGLNPRVEVSENGKSPSYIEPLLWRKGDQVCLAFIKNYAYHASVSGEGTMKGQAGAPRASTIEVKLNLPARNIKNIRTGKSFGSADSFKDSFKPWEANLYLFESGE